MVKKSVILHSKNYLILNILILLGYVLFYPIIKRKLEFIKFGNYTEAYTTAIILVAKSKLRIKEAFKEFS
tara:strand:- start:232 stop:441 length:210 start_codon:yes stop_codon:yes gene_type:complete